MRNVLLIAIILPIVSCNKAPMKDTSFFIEEMRNVCDESQNLTSMLDSLNFYLDKKEEELRTTYHREITEFYKSKPSLQEFNSIVGELKRDVVLLNAQAIKFGLREVNLVNKLEDNKVNNFTARVTEIFLDVQVDTTLLK